MRESYLSWAGVALVTAGVAILTGHPAWGVLTGAVLVLVGAGVVARTARSRSGAGDEPKGQRVSNNLVILSSAAIIAVYAAGFHRTRAADDEFEAQAARRRVHPRPAAALVQNPIQKPTAQIEAVQPPPSASDAPLLASTSRPSPVPAPSMMPKDRLQHQPTDTEKPAAAAPATIQKSIAAAKPAPAQSAQAPEQKQVAMSTPPAPVTAPAAPVADPPATALAASGPAATTPATPPIPARVPGQVPGPADAATRPNPAVAAGAVVLPKLLYKDGTFLGWGRSAHGNIQASVIVQNGRISSTAIARCETAYSCDWIAKLPPQVVATQDPAVIDIVTGASDSSYAFQDAVTAALFKAQRGE